MAKFLHILIPVYGPSPYLDEALNSVVAMNDFEDVEVTVVDDASETSQAETVVSKFSKFKVNYIRNEINFGLASNFEKCMNLSIGKYTLIMGSDDRILPNVIKDLRNTILEHGNLDIIQLKTNVINADGNRSSSAVDLVKRAITPKTRTINGTRLFASLMVGNWTYFPAICWRTANRDQFHWEKNYLHAVDLALIARLANSGICMGITDNPGFEYRRHNASISSQLANTTTRVSEELDVHYWAKNNYRGEGRKLVQFLAVLAPTIRLHAIQSAVANHRVNPVGSKNIFKIATGKLRPLKSNGT